MTPLTLVHAVAAFLWFGVVGAEVAIELRGCDAEGMRRAAVDHYWIDATVELPLLAVVMVTGAWLTARAWPLTPAQVAMVVCGMAAVAANVACVAFVFARHRAMHDAALVRVNRRRVFACAIAGGPFGLSAAVIGLKWMLGG